MRQFLFCLILFIAIMPAAFAQPAPVIDKETTEQIKDTADSAVEKTADKAADIVDAAGEKTDDIATDIEQSTLVEDLKKARDIIMGSAGDNAFARGLIIALFQPMFLAAMFCLGLWAGQMSERFKHVWAIPVLVFLATFIGAFITAYHSEWKPEFQDGRFKALSALESTDVVTIVVGLLIGAAVGMRLVFVPLFAMLGAIAAGLALGFSQTSDLGEHHNSLLPFWAGFGLTGLLVNIFGIGFETFLQSINLNMVTRWIGLATVALSFYFGMHAF